MCRMFMLAFALLCSTALLYAQDPSAPGSTPSSPAQAGSASGQTTVEGCLQGSNGSFTLTDSAGTTYQLQGDSAKLTKHSGHQVQVTGSPSGSSSATSAGGSSAAGGSQTLTVEKVKMVSDSCKSASK